MKQLPIAVMKGVFMCVFLYRLHVPTTFGGRAGFDMEGSHVFPQRYTVALTLAEGGAVGGGLELEPVVS